MDNYTITQLDVTGYGDQPLDVTHWTNGSDTLAVLLPGQGYTNQMPAMFYAHEMARQRGYDVLEVNYSYRSLPEDTPMEERVARLKADASAAFRAGRGAGDYRHVVLIGKSLGTIAMTTLLNEGIDLPRKMIWLTPLLRIPEVRSAMDATAGVSLTVIGSSDAQFDPAFLSHLRGRGSIVEAIDGANHGFEFPGDVVRGVEAMRQIVVAMDHFL